MSADSLTPLARQFYERTKGKLVISVVIGAGCCGVLARMVELGGILNTINMGYADYDDDVPDKELTKSLNYVMQGLGFSCFFLIFGVVMLLVISIYNSPIISYFASENEMETLKTPKEDVHKVEDGPAV